MYTTKELKLAFEVVKGKSSYYYARDRVEPIELQVYYCLLQDIINNKYFRVPIKELKQAVKNSFIRVMSTKSELVKWLEICHTLTVERLKYELDLLESIGKGIADIKAGRVIRVDDVGKFLEDL